MKIRKGFISNSSSSSFVIQGIILEDEILGYELYEKGWTELHKLGIGIQPVGNYFSSDSAKGYIVGMEHPDMEDGIPYKITPFNNKLVIEKLKEIGVSGNESDVNIWVQYISNDNY